MRTITRALPVHGLMVGLLLCGFAACDAVPDQAVPAGEGSPAAPAAAVVAAPASAPEQSPSRRVPDDFFDSRVVRDVEAVRTGEHPPIGDLVVERSGNAATYSYRLWDLGRVTGRIVVTAGEQQHEVAVEGTPIFFGRYPTDITLPPIAIDDRGLQALTTRLGESAGRALAAAMAAVLAEPAVERAVDDAAAGEVR